MSMHVVRSLGGLFLAISLCAVPATADEVLRWRMNSLLYPKVFGEAGQQLADTVRRLSRGTFQIEVHDRMVLDQNAFGALESNLIDAVWGSAGHHHREDPALTIFTGFPFGPDPAGFTAWMKVGGGSAALEAIYARHDLKSLYCGILPAEGGGWFVEPIKDIGDLDGLAMRSFGYSARVLRKLGVVPYELPAQEIRPAFETGLIDAAEFSLPSVDADLGLGQAAQHLYFPGWQQPVTSLELLMTQDRWESLSDDQRTILEVACEANLATTASVAIVEQSATLARFREAGIELHRWPDDVLDALRAAWDDVIAEDVAGDPLLADAWNGYLIFREEYGAWESTADVDWFASAGYSGEPQSIKD